MASGNTKKKGFLHGMRKRSSSFAHTDDRESLTDRELRTFLRSLSLDPAHLQPTKSSQWDEILELEGDQEQLPKVLPKLRLRSYSDSAAGLSKHRAAPALKTIPERFSRSFTANTTNKTNNFASDFTFFEDDSEDDIWSSVESFDSGDVEIYSNSPPVARRECNGGKGGFGPMPQRLDRAVSQPGTQVFSWLPNGNRVMVGFFNTTVSLH